MMRAELWMRVRQQSVVSNHGGRQLDSVSATIRALPEVVAASGRTA